MIVTLYTSNKLYKFKLPEELSGSYSFQDDDGNKIVNIEVRNDKWVLYSTSESFVVNGKETLNYVEISNGGIYYVQYENVVYPIYVTSPNSFYAYKYTDGSSFTIGLNGNVIYNTPLTQDYNVSLTFSNSQIVLQNQNQKPVYANGIATVSPSIQVKTGTVIDIYGLVIIVCTNYIFISKNQRLQLNMPSTMQLLNIQKPQQLLSEEIKINNLYNKDDYFSKSARLYRKVGEKEIEFATPPSLSSGEETPAFLSVIPMIAMGITSVVSLLDLINRIKAGKTSLSESMSELIIYIVMLISTLFIPLITQFITDRIRKRNLKKAKKKYLQYLDNKQKEIEETFKTEEQILKENLLAPKECAEIIRRKSVAFWSKRNDQEDFLDIRIGIGRQPLKAKINFSKEEFTVDENDLVEKAESLIEKYKYIENVPYSFNLYKSFVTGVMGKQVDTNGFVNNVVLQLISSYSYEDLKIVLFTSDKNKANWEYMKYLPYAFSDYKDVRFYAITNDDVKNVTEFLNTEFEKRNTKENNNYKDEEPKFKPHYVIIVDGFDNVKQNEFINKLLETNNKTGFSVIVAESKLSKLPSKCSDFIILDGANSIVIKSTYQEPIKFQSEIDNTIDMLTISKQLANIPLELETAAAQLPDTVTFLEMENVGKVDQLNILNRWNMNDSTQSLKAEIGYGTNGEMMYLDLHEKYHGPHGLIAGMTGSGKSEFIITYILSMCINYSPDDVAFILIDYKGGGLTGAFENITNKIFLPHLAGTITNLDKAEMDRTLVSIESEIKRRQEKFREAKDRLAESTLDIYKYQRLYKEGKIEEPIPHLFIICDEFAELKSQQPDFMSNLISVARIGRSLGIHLILATQKPSGVVDDQIWSNTKFRVCLKVQDQSDSNEMLKRPEAASLKQTGRYYLQVGYDEYFALGQSAWCGAKYYPSDDIKIEEDRSINFISNSGKIIRSITDNQEVKVEAQGEQITAVIKSIIDVANKANKHAKKLWLTDVKPIILENEIVDKYAIPFSQDIVDVVVGEYDAPERQKQGPVIYNYLQDGNTVIYGTDTLELENLLDKIIFFTCKNYPADAINFYIIDYGSESLKKFNKLPHVGGIVLAGEKEKYNNLMKLIRYELKSRKKILSEYGGTFEKYNQESSEKLPIITIILNNYQAIFEANDNLYDEFADMVADSERYGIVYILTASSSSSINGRVAQFFNNSYVFKLKDAYDATYIFGVRTDKVPRNTFGRGLINNDGVHEFQTVSIIEDKDKETECINELISSVISTSKTQAKKIPTLPSKVDMDEIISYITDITSVPVGINKAELNPETINLKETPFGIISSNKLDNTKDFVASLILLFKQIDNLNIVVFDPKKNLNLNTSVINNYINNDFDKYLDNMINYLRNCIENNNTSSGVIIIYGLNKLIQNIDSEKLNELVYLIKEIENYSLIVVEANNKIGDFSFEEWYSKMRNDSFGIWIGKGAGDQGVFPLNSFNKDLMEDFKNDMGIVFLDGNEMLCKLIDLVKKAGNDNE